MKRCPWSLEETMYECPACHGMMEEISVLVTDCCGMELEDECAPCPGCGSDEPLLVDGELRLQCVNCGYVE